MRDENGIELSDREVLHEALNHMADALAFLFETDDPLYKSLAFMLDSVIKLGTVIYNDPDRILDATAVWQSYEDELYHRHNSLKVIK